MTTIVSGTSGEPSSPCTGRQRCREVFGPLVVGAVGGGVFGLLSLASSASLSDNMATTYDKFPSVDRPWMAMHFQLGTAVVAILTVLGFLAPVAMGLCTAWIARPRDAWADLSAGITTGLAATLAALASGLGMAVILALVVVPSINDLTVFGQATRAPAGGSAANPSDVLARRYPDLESVPPEQRGNLYFAKIVSDQVAGSSLAMGISVLMGFIWYGGLGLFGTLAAGHLLRRGDRRWALMIPYLELSISNAVLCGLLLHRWMQSLLGNGTMDGATRFGVAWLVLAGVNLAILVAVQRRLPWSVRVMLIAVWCLTLLHVFDSPVPLLFDVVVYAGALAMVVPRFLSGGKKLRPASA